MRHGKVLTPREIIRLHYRGELGELSLGLSIADWVHYMWKKLRYHFRSVEFSTSENEKIAHKILLLKHYEEFYNGLRILRKFVYEKYPELRNTFEYLISSVKLGIRSIQIDLNRSGCLLYTSPSPRDRG